MTEQSCLSISRRAVITPDLIFDLTVLVLTFASAAASRIVYSIFLNLLATLRACVADRLLCGFDFSIVIDSPQGA